MDQEANAILSDFIKTPPSDPSHTEREISAALIDLFGRTGAVVQVRSGNMSDGALIISLMNAGLMRAIPQSAVYNPQIQLILTPLGHEIRTARIMRDLDVSNRVMAQLERHISHVENTVLDDKAFESASFEETRLAEERVRLNMETRSRELVVLFEQAVASQTEDEFIETHRVEFAAMSADQYASLERLDKSLPILAVIRAIQYQVAEDFLRDPE